MSKGIVKEFNLGDGRTISVETGRLAKQADGSVVVRCGNAMLLATVVSSKEAKEGIDFLPLSVDYQEKFSAVGRYPGGFLKRETRMSEYEILTSRLVDRALRPMFPDDYHSDTQVIITLISGDINVETDAMAGFAASCAITISDIPFNGPISEVRVARIDGSFVINPPTKDIERADMDMIVAGNHDSILMVEGEMKEVSEMEMLDAIRFAHEAIKIQCQFQIEFREMCGNKPKREYSHETNDEVLNAQVAAFCYDKAYAIARSANPDKHAIKPGVAARAAAAAGAGRGQRFGALVVVAEQAGAGNRAPGVPPQRQQQQQRVEAHRAQKPKEVFEHKRGRVRWWWARSRFRSSGCVRGKNPANNAR